MSKEDKNKMKNPDNVDFDKLSDISTRIDEMMSKVQEEEMKVDLSSLDEKFMRKLGGSEFVYMTEKLNKKLDKSYYSTKPKQSDQTEQIKPSSFSWFNFALAGFLLMVIVSSGLIVYIWPDDTGRNESDTEVVTNFAQEVAQPKVQMRPSSVTATGFVKEDSEFVFEVEGEFEGDPEEAIIVTPAVPLDVETTKEGNVTILTAVPQEPLQREESYTFAVEAGTEFSDGSEIEEDIEWFIPIEPYFKVVSVSPFEEEVNVDPETSIAFTMSHDDFTFDDFVENFSIVPFVQGTFEKIQENVLFTPDDGFAPGVEYTVTLANLLQTTEGESLENEYITKFTTSSEVATESLGMVDELTWYSGNLNKITRVINVIFAQAKAPSGTEVVDYSIYKVVNKKHLDVMQESEILGEQDFRITEEEEIDPSGQLNVDPASEEEELIENEEDELEDVIDNSVLIAKESLSTDQPFEYTPRDKGLYLVTATVDGQTIHQYFLVTNLGVVVTQYDDEMQGWIYDTQTIHDSMDGLYEVYDENGELIDAGATDKSGYFRSEMGKYLIIRYREDMDIWVNKEYGEVVVEEEQEVVDGEESYDFPRESERGIASSKVVLADR